MIETDLAYAAAMIDGEGSIVVSRDRRGNYETRVMLYNTDERLIHWFNSRWPAVILKHHTGFARKDGGLGRPCWRWQLAGISRVQTFLEAVSPYLIVKKRRSELALEMLAASHPSAKNYTPAERAIRDSVYASWMVERAA